MPIRLGPCGATGHLAQSLRTSYPEEKTGLCRITERHSSLESNPCKILLILFSSPVLLPQICANLWRQKKGPARAISSVVERLLHTQEVAGSNPASRSVFASCFRVLRWLNPLPKERGRFDFPLCDSIKDSLGVGSATPAQKSPGN